MKISPFLAISASSASADTSSFDIRDYPNHLIKCKPPKGSSEKNIFLLDADIECTYIKCRYLPKLKISKISNIKKLPNQYLDCPSPIDSGCEMTWGVDYQNKAKGATQIWNINTGGLIPCNGLKSNPDKVKKTGNVFMNCLSTGEILKSKCNPKKTGSVVSFEWTKDITCPGQGEAWATWEEWSTGSNSKCEPEKVKRSRQCNDGDHPGSATPCKTKPAGRESETKIFWPKVCKKCHADMGMMFTPGTLNIPKLPLPKVLYDTDEDKFDDGFVVEGQGAVKVACYDNVNSKGVAQYVKPLNQKCKCDNKGCRFGDAPLCQGEDYFGYGHDYLWMPGAADTFKPNPDPELEAIEVNADYTITYKQPAKYPDPRFENRIKWWEPNGPSICRYFRKLEYDS